MSERKKGIPEAVLEQGLKAASKAVQAVLADPRGQEVLAAAVGAAQRGKRRLDAVQGKVMRAAGMATREDYEEVARGMARLKRKLRDLGRQVDAGPGKPGAGEP
ncbi:MAG TPA: hypothetical protein VFM53_09245 [Anaeromyxobacteraceae bacterium]|nr:hypothetical protein [Anaeromyxobacteraceae bacterium]